jgi:hypothetical protein
MCVLQEATLVPGSPLKETHAGVGGASSAPVYSARGRGLSGG